MVDEFYDEEEYDEMEEDEILESDDDIDDEAIAEVMQSVPNIDLQEAKNSLKRYNGDVSRAVADFKGMSPSYYRRLYSAFHDGSSLAIGNGKACRRFSCSSQLIQLV